MKGKQQEKETLLSYLTKQKSTLIIIMVAVLAFLLLIIPSGTSNNTTKNDIDRIDEYEKKMEAKIADLCSGVKGVSSITVSVYFDSGFETVYAYNEESRATSNGINSEKKYVTIGSGNDESMVCLFERMPHISGVAVVCKGGGNSMIASEIINLISSAFDVPKNKIYVAEGKN